MQRTKRPTELKIVSEKKTLINTNLGNACEYVTVKYLGEFFRGKYLGHELLYKNGRFFIRKVFGPFSQFRWKCI